MVVVMTKDEALRLALEALEWQQHMLITAMQYSAAKGMTFLGHPPNPNEAITAIKAALEAKDEPVKKLQVTLEDRPVDIELAQYKRMFEDACANLGAINQALGLDFNDGGAESILFAIEELKGRSQEPVAWMVYTLDGKSVCVTDNPTNFTPEHRALPLYTTPPQRTWAGLTELEKAEITNLKWWDWEDTFDIDGFIRAIEAKLKEKNT
jgi:hypothetical protein